MNECDFRQAYMAADDAGNILRYSFFSYEGKDVACLIQLKSAKEKRVRKLGYVTLNDGVYHVTRVRAKHLHQQSKSYGFCHEVLKNKTFFGIRKVHIIEDDTQHYVVPVHTFENFGSYLHFKTQGFERQRFLRIEIIETFKTEQYATGITTD
jgi:hypothetical protein